MSVALFGAFPELEKQLPWARLGDWPTPVEPVRGLDEVWVKRDDSSHPRYGGNKIRTLEPLFGAALAAGMREIWATGAFGSNHAVATAMAAPEVGLEPGAIVFPQLASRCAQDNALALLASGARLDALRTIVSLPLAMWRTARRPRAVVMVPGGATPLGAMGAVSAAFEIIEQVNAGLMPPPARIVLAVGSTATTAGLLAGFALARAAGGLGRMTAPPLIHAVRVTPWPVTAKARVVWLARRVLEGVARRLGHPRWADGAELAARLLVIGGHLGWRYGRVTRAALEARSRFAGAGGPPLDVVYSAKSGAALLAAARAQGPTLFWATKSSRPLALPDGDAARAELVASAPPSMRRWLGLAVTD